ncbi:ribonuclease [Parenemella sanctibonifatiensis]|uniref:Ribonuclease n=2 Tax=Parenemella sanctibonifatiensis TaxID=2016505 RepID=A0A255EDM4_9ACTN|nr:ribonuclease [Parenemella sanctibonifatiensis]
MRVMTTRLLAALLAVVLGLTLTACTLTVEAPPSTEETAAGATGSAPQERTDPDSGLDWVDLADLPPEAAETMELIESDGPFPYDRDGITFQNREGLLPDQPRGYYREYTVPTPGERDRGARRIVAGEQGEYYWTADHYESFERIRT